MYTDRALSDLINYIRRLKSVGYLVSGYGGWKLLPCYVCLSNGTEYINFVKYKFDRRYTLQAHCTKAEQGQ